MTDRRLWLLLLFLILLTEKSEGQLLIGPMAGANYSWTSFGDKDLKDTYKTTPVFGYHVGGHVAFRVRKRFFLHTSLLYSTKGKIEESDAGGLHNEVRYKYIEMPINYTVDFKGKLGKNKEFKYFLGIGPVVSYWLGGKGTLENNDAYEFGYGPQDYKIVFDKDPQDAADDEMVVQDPNRIQLGLNFIAGLSLEPSPGKTVLVSLRYELGHTYLSGTTDGQYGISVFEDPMKIRNQGIRLSAAYMIDLKTADRKRGKTTNRVKTNRRRR